MTTVAGSSKRGTEDGEGGRARFNNPLILALDERGRLLHADLWNAHCVRVVEAGLAAPAGLGAKDTGAVAKNEVLEDYRELLDDTELADVVFAVDGERIPAYRGVLAARSAYSSRGGRCGRVAGGRGGSHQLAYGPANY